MNRTLSLFALFLCLSAFSSCEKEPEPVKVASVTLDRTSLTMTEGETMELTATVLPENADNKKILWSTSNSSIASVHEGKVTAVKEGQATITATSDDGLKTATCSVKVNALFIPVTGVSLDKSEYELTEGDWITLSATVSPVNATNRNITWTSDNDKVATVKDGRVNAVKPGTAIITVKTEDGGRTATCKVTVKERIYPVESVALDKTEVEITEGDEITLIAAITPENATNKKVIWSSDNDNIATVKDGRVVAVKPGTAIITVKTEDGAKTATCKVTVKERIYPVESVALDKTEMTLAEGSSETLSATILPSNASNKNVRWASSNSTVASVDASGKVSALKAGTATITVTTEDGGKTASCKVTVIAHVSGVSLNKAQMTLDEGRYETLIATILPSNASNKNVRWVSSNSTVASVDASGKVSALKAGTATITVTTEDGGKTASCKVTVIARVSGVSLNKTRITLEVGRYETLIATILPSNASNKNVRWSSSNSAVASVDASGRVTAVKVGTATITVTSEDGAKTSSCAVTVVPRPVESVSLNKTTLELKEGYSETLIATINPQMATNKNVIWSSSDVTIATVDSYGKVLAKEEGKAIITVTTVDGNKTAQCTVTVIGANSIGEGGNIVTPNSK